MAGEAILINPRHRRRRRKAKRARSHRRKRARVRRNPFVRATRRRRRGRVRARRGRRIRRNPRIPLLGNVNMQAIGAGAAGFIATKWGTGFLTGMLPAEWSAGAAAPLVKIGAKAVVGLVAIPMVLKMVGMKRFAGAAAIGGGIAVAVDIFDTYIAPRIGMSDYEQGYITAYEPGQITGTGDMAVDGAYGGGAY